MNNEKNTPNSEDGSSNSFEMSSKTPYDPRVSFCGLAEQTRRAQSKARQLMLILWKNLLLRRRHWFLTFLEIAVPLALFILIVYLRTVTNEQFQPKVVDEVTRYKPKDESELRQLLCFSSLGIWVPFKKKCFYSRKMDLDRQLFWGPETEFTRHMMTLIRQEIFYESKYLTKVDSKEEMDTLVRKALIKQREKYNKTVPYHFMGIFFQLENKTDEPPKNLVYELRFQNAWFTELVYPFFQLPGPGRIIELPFLGDYENSGFSILQTIIDRSYMKLATRRKYIVQNITLQTQMYPYPPYTNDYGLSQLYSSLLPAVIALSFVLLSPTLIKSVVSDKETGVKELMRAMGVDSKLIWIGWFLYSFATVFITCVLASVAVKVHVKGKSEMGYGIPAIFEYSDPTLFFLILILYSMASICFCLAISSFFNKPTLATTVGVLVWLMSFFLPSQTIDMNYKDMSRSSKLFGCLLPNVAMKLCFKIISIFEGREVGIHWSNLFAYGNSNDNLSIGLILIFLVFDIVLFMFVTWYVEKVMPGKYGVAYKWNFLFQKSYWRGYDYRSAPSHTDSYVKKVVSAYTEAEPKDLMPGIIIKGLRKEFRPFRAPVKVAVEEVDMTCYKGQCTVLLGHNGAGKTTTMSVITGLLSPTSGYAEVNGWNITTNMKEVRLSLGLCPQHNTLFNDLTVEQHLLFFGQMKGLSYKQAKAEAKTYLTRLHFAEKKNSFGKELSGGMKRKLCFSIAMIGGSETVILDEPSSGLDPESRRAVWDVIQEERQIRTILLTTHHMEEADVLGDRVAIMSEGRVFCSGSTVFLKNTFGDGYLLTVAGHKGSDIARIESIAKEYLPETSRHSYDGLNYCFKVPNEPKMLPSLLDHLSNSRETLRIDHISLSLSTMDQVFLKVGEISYKMKERTTRYGSQTSLKKYFVLKGWDETGSIDLVNGNPVDNKSSASYDVVTLDSSKGFGGKRIRGFDLARQRFLALIRKKCIYTRRKWILFISQTTIPVIITLLCLFVDSFLVAQKEAEKPRRLDLDMFTYSHAFVECRTDNQDSINMAEKYNELFHLPHEVEITDEMESSLLDASYKDISVYRENHVTSASFSVGKKDPKSVTRVLFQSIPIHALGVGVNLMDNAILHTRVGTDYNIVTYNSPLPAVEIPVEGMDLLSTFSGFLFSMVMPFALCFLTSSFLVFPLQERVSKSRRIQLMTGTSPYMMWLSVFLCDIFNYIITSLLVLACFVLYDSKGIFTVHGAPGAIFMVILFYGLAATPLSYIFSRLFDSAASGFAILILINICIGMILSLITYILGTVGSQDLVDATHVVGNVSSLFPAYPVSKAFMGIIETSNKNKFCDFIRPEIENEVCKQIKNLFKDSPYLGCCPQYCTKTNTCFKPQSYYEWMSPGIGAHLMFLFIDMVIMLVFMWLMETRITSYMRQEFWNLVRKYKSKSEATSVKVDEEDVLAEKLVVEQLIQNPTEGAFVAHDLRKVFEPSGITAVNGVSFSVKQGECLGLLGINGAGKTTTFRMLTGDEIQTSGDARIGKYYLSKSHKKFLQNIGYCPQFDAIIPELTGEELLILMANLRGMEPTSISYHVDDLINQVDLNECAHRISSTYSGGNKRKLSTAMALLSDPPIIFLDEPTAGVDPVSRRRMWDAIRTATRNGQSVILTSHSMDECDSLCSKIAIMARGDFKCFGSSLRLKMKFGSGHELQIKLKDSISSDSSTSSAIANAGGYENAVRELKSTISNCFQGSVLEDEHRGMLTYRIPSTVSWSEIFRVMESLKGGNSVEHEGDTSDSKRRDFRGLIEDYAATDPSLEQVFLTFAKESIKSKY